MDVWQLSTASWAQMHHPILGLTLMQASNPVFINHQNLNVWIIRWRRLYMHLSHHNSTSAIPSLCIPFSVTILRYILAVLNWLHCLLESVLKCLRPSLLRACARHFPPFPVTAHIACESQEKLSDAFQTHDWNLEVSWPEKTGHSSKHTCIKALLIHFTFCLFVIHPNSQLYVLL